MPMRFSVVFARNRQRKTKKWEDGTLRLSPNGNKATLYDSKEHKADEMMINGRTIHVGDELVTERQFEVLIEDVLENATPNQCEPSGPSAPPLVRSAVPKSTTRLARPDGGAGRSTFSLRAKFRPPTRISSPRGSPTAPPSTASRDTNIDDRLQRQGGRGMGHHHHHHHRLPSQSKHPSHHSGAPSRSVESAPPSAVLSKRRRTDNAILTLLGGFDDHADSPPSVPHTTRVSPPREHARFPSVVTSNSLEQQPPHVEDAAFLEDALFLMEEDDEEGGFLAQTSAPAPTTRPPPTHQSAYGSPSPWQQPSETVDRAEIEPNVPVTTLGGPRALPPRLSLPLSTASRTSVPLCRAFVPPATAGVGTIGGPPRRVGRAADLRLLFPSRLPPGTPVQKLSRVAEIAAEFRTLAEYRACLLTALVEVLNLQLADTSAKYHSLLATLNLTEYSGSSRAQPHRAVPHGPQCTHGPAKLVAVQKEGKNKGRLFYTCPKGRTVGCNFFKWADEAGGGAAAAEDSQVDRRIVVTSAESLEQVCRASQIMLYSECSIQSEKRRKRKNPDAVPPKTFFIRLDRRPRGTDFGKRDLWVVSTSVLFEAALTVVAESVFFGPSSEGDVELHPLTRPPFSIKPGNTLFAIQICNARTELSCIDAVQTRLTLDTMPLLPTLISPVTRSNSAESQLASGRRGARSPLAFSASRADIDELCVDFCKKWRLNKDQGQALDRFSRMLPCSSSDDEDVTRNPILLVHGVFGSGKSYFLAVLVLFLMAAIDQYADPFGAVNGHPEWAILISSSTNVAVDRILTLLLEQGFNDFVRVGSARKIAPVIMPYSTHGSEGSDKKELTQLRSMLNEPGLSAQERSCISHSIEKLKMGVNRDMLSKTRVVAATLAATEFPCLDDFIFPIIILDEACQMTEPSAVLPLTRFGCQSLVMVGDPKQLPPTIAGVESAHSRGLEQSLFERLMQTACADRYQMLRIQYRCHPHISAMANRLTYSGDLIDGVSVTDRAPIVPGLPPVCFFDCDAGVEERQGGGSYVNQREAEFIVSMVGALLEAEVVHCKQIGVISTYKAQSRLIEQLLGDSNAPNSKLVTSSTVDAFQGGEREIVFLSCVRTKGMGFIADPARTNVAMTRGKRHLFVVGKYRNLLQHSSAGGAEGSALWRGVLSYFSEMDGGRMKAVAGLTHLRELITVAGDTVDFVCDSDDGRSNSGSRDELCLPSEEMEASTNAAVDFIAVSDPGSPTTSSLDVLDELDMDDGELSPDLPVVSDHSATAGRAWGDPSPAPCCSDLGIAALLDGDLSSDEEQRDAPRGREVRVHERDVGSQDAGCTAGLNVLDYSSDENVAGVFEHSRASKSRPPRKPLTALPDFNFSDDAEENSSDDFLQTPPASVRPVPAAD